MNREQIYHLLARSETIDAEAPYSCLPPGDEMWLSLKTTLILAVFKAEEEHTSHLVDDVIRLEEELKEGNDLMIRLTDQCRELEAEQEEIRKDERERITDFLQDLIEMSSQNKEPTIKVAMMDILQAIKEEE